VPGDAAGPVAPEMATERGYRYRHERQRIRNVQ
jgi:hypothetical protein